MEEKETKRVCCISRQGDLCAGTAPYQLKEAVKIQKLIDKLNK